MNRAWSRRFALASRAMGLCMGAWLTGCAGMEAADTQGVQPIEVRTVQGLVHGRSDGETRSFLGLRYAAAPVGENRFRAPQPAPVLTATQMATEFGPTCAQLTRDEVDAGSSEDCLTLNVWAPSHVQKPRPVMVFVHGGGFVGGSGSSPTYEGQALSAAQDVVVVTLNYRLGPLGFLAHAALTSEAGTRPASNFGLLDQQAALAWVRDNIAAFGGDPRNVTLFGESAGGISVCVQLLSPSAAGLFHRAIVQSGPCSTFKPPTQTEAEAQGAILASKVGCTAGDARAVARCLRDLPLRTVLTALPQKPEVVFGDGYSWMPAMASPTIPGEVRARLARGDLHKVPLVVGANADEGTAFAALGVKLDTEADIRAALASVFAPPVVDSVIAHYGPSPLGTTAGLKILGDAFVCDARRLARWARNAGAPTFYYHFTRAFAYLLPNLGAFHGAELPYIFHTPLEFVTIKPNEEAFSAAMQGYWARFAASGSPNGVPAAADIVSWPPYDAVGDSCIRLDLAITTESSLRKADCDFWDTLSP